MPDEDNEQLKRFNQTVRDLDCDESEEAFERKLKKVARATVSPAEDGKEGNR